MTYVRSKGRACAVAAAADAAASTGTWLRAAMAVALSVLALVWAQQAFARSAPESFADLVDRVIPAVVNVSSTQKVPQSQQMQDLDEMFRDFLDRREGQPPQRPPRGGSSLGSGFIIDPAGYIVTNNHVIEDAEEIMVLTHDNEELKATIVGRDEKTDLALLKVDAKKPLPALKWGDSEALRIGDWVMAIGNPFGLGGSVTAGIVSARQRDINSGPYDDYIQTDASINRGNSGGPMFNMDGEVVGINTAIFSPSGGSVGIGFAIPANLARPIISQIKEFGKPKRGWLGVRIQTVSPELAEGLRLKEPKGALVASVTKDGPADKAGIKQGDVVLKFDGKEITQMRGLPRIVAETETGKTTDVVIWRKGSEVTLRVTVGELTEEAEQKTLASIETPPSAAATVDLLGLKLSAITDELRKKHQIPGDAEGVVVVEVAQTGPAAEKDMRPGDVIAEVDQKAVTSPEDVAQRVKAAQDNGYRVVTLLVNRGGEFQWIALKITQ
ncbi:DegQ family serine endoprotease [Dongia deserti]|uniref:DegQ family serine endoprotease n=1 Tax=Dongia deserti TaxID=2268030 RepID=UPI000E64C40E|nr:DegQ family serine endoprotease [Dongia deserti]